MDNVRGLLAKAIEDFESEIDKLNKEECERFGACVMPLAIDTDCEDVEGKPYLKVVNHVLQDAYSVYLDTIVAHYKDGILKDLVRALRTGEFIRLNGVTRIVGYYSRIQNWNKSKIGELRDRHVGNYLWKDKPENKKRGLCHI